ncbi:MAG: hypothetical protein JRI66_03315 [Deltaproteobacteria bacterium]|nr:hypothetical protein [Deltaproteobacteria bacterium]
MTQSAKVVDIDSPSQDIPNYSVLEAIQANIRRYGWQALAVRLLAITLGSLFIAVGVAAGRAGGNLIPASIRIWPVVCLFLLWMLDGHFKFLQGHYIELYRQAVAMPLNDAIDMAVKVDDGFNVVSLWRPMVMVPYVAMIGLIALGSLGF